MNDQPIQYVDVSVLNRERANDFNKWIQEMEQMIAMVDLYMEGKQVVTDAITRRTGILEDKGSKLCNLKGRQYVHSRLISYLNPNLYMSMLENHDVERCYRIDMANFVCDLHLSLEEFDMTPSGARRVTSLVAPVIFFALRKAQTDKKFMYQSMNSSNQQPTSEAAGAWAQMARAIGMR